MTSHNALSQGGFDSGRDLPVYPKSARGFTLVEMIMVMAVLAVVAGLVVINAAGVGENAERTVASASLCAVRDALCGCPGEPGYLGDMKSAPDFNPAYLRLHCLLSTNFTGYRPFDPQTARGWRGPYVRTAGAVRNTNAGRGGLFPAAGERRWTGDATFRDRGFYAADGAALYGTPGEAAVADPWGNPIVLQIPAAGLVRARLVSAGPDGTLNTRLDDAASERGDDLVLFLSP